MADFKQMALAMAQKNKIDTDQKLSDIKNQKDSMTQFLNLQISQLELQKNEQQKVESDLKFEEKRNKVKAEFIKQFLTEGGGQGGQGPVAVGGNLLDKFSPDQIDEDAQDLPILANA